MNEITQPTVPPASVKPAKRARKRVATGPRKVDPGIAAIHEETRKKIADYRKTCNSALILQTIISKRLPQLTQSDQQKLFDTLTKTVKPMLIPSN